MTDVTAARDSMERAQAQLDQVHGDLARLDEVLAWLPDADARVRALHDYATEQEPDDVAAVLRADAGAVTPPVVNEDAVWEAIVDFDERVRRLLRVVAASLAAGLDDTPVE